MVGNLRKIVTFYIIKGKLHGRAEIRNLSSRVEKYFTRSLCSLVKYFSTLEDKFRVFSSDKRWRSWSDGPFKERALLFQGEISCFQQCTKKCFLPVVPFISSFSLVDVRVCVLIFILQRWGGEGG